MSEHTVKVHLRAILGKLNLRNRSRLPLCNENGLVGETNAPSHFPSQQLNPVILPERITLVHGTDNPHIPGLHLQGHKKPAEWRAFSSSTESGNQASLSVSRNTRAMDIAQ
jgi:hypothetical protein